MRLGVGLINWCRYGLRSSLCSSYYTVAFGLVARMLIYLAATVGLVAYRGSCSLV